ncbi:MAG: serine/threonine-protein kinase [Thermoanaerobaculia bacterium]
MASKPWTMSFPPAAPTPSFPFRILSRVGEGAMGVVYRALDPALDRPVAIKVLHREVLESRDAARARENRLRFLQEARAGAALSHSNVTVIHHVGEEGGQPYIVMEWLEGSTLEEVLSKRAPLAPAEANELAGQLLAALEAAHARGIVHRDIKPANLVLLTDGRLKVTDFGIARLQEGELVKTRAGEVFATPLFASPEQLRGEQVDARSDLFSAAVVLYQALSGELPFEGQGYLEVAHKVLSAEPRRLEQLVPGLSSKVAAVVHRALAKDRARRFGSAAEMARALAAAVAANEPQRPEAAGSELAPAPGQGWLEGLVAEPPAALAQVLHTWPARPLGPQPVAGLLERLLEVPLHAEPFSGAARLGSAWVLLADGVVWAALDERTGLAGDRVLELLPERAEATLHAAPNELGAPGVRVLASWLNVPIVRHGDLDSSFVNLEALARRLCQEGFAGFLELATGTSWGRVLLAGGRSPLRLFGGDWQGLPLDRPWPELVAALPLKARVLEAQERHLSLSYRRLFPGFEVLTQRGTGTGAAADPVLVPQPSSSAHRGARETSPLALEKAPAYRLLGWLLSDGGAFFRERDRAAKWKYLVEWLADVRSARLYAELAGSGFDFATFDGTGKLLHLARRVDFADREAASRFIDDVARVKAERIKTGDVGGALLVARQLSPGLLDAYGGGGSLSESGRRFAVEESFTGYEGFVRVGPRRGFHLLLVEESESGFRPILP